MKSRIGILVAISMLVAGTVAMAGDYHEGLNLLCSDCHVMHFSQSHTYAPNGTSGSFTALATTGGPFTYLLRQEVNDLCLTCHDGSISPPDVLEAKSGTIVRQAGALNRTNTMPYYDATGHTLDSTDTAPGGTFANPDGLNCTNCHNPHGYGGGTANPYRNLSGNISGFANGITYVNLINDTNFDVFQRIPQTYDVENVDLNEPLETTGESAFGKFCAQCHDNFHSAPGSGSNVGGTGVDPEGFIRHPSSGVDIGAVGGGHSDLAVYEGGELGTKKTYVKVMSPTGVWPSNGTTASGLPGDLTPTCISCHKGHGNQNAFGLIYMGEILPVTEQGSTSIYGTGTDPGTYFDLCKQCHVQGGL